MALHLHRAPRTDQLADALGELLAVPPDDPFATDVVVVPAKGVERWLSQRLSHRLGAAPGRGDGVCAGVDFRSPWSLFAEVSGTREEDPWAPDVLVWPLLAAIDECLDEPWAATLARHVGHGLDGEEGDLRRGRRFSVARRLARLFSSYAVQRPGVVADWAAGRDTDGCGRPVPDDLAWQPPLWRRLAERVDARAPHERQVETLDRLRTDPAGFDLPDRLSLFGHTRLPCTEVALLGAVAEHRDVHLWSPHPSDALWQALRPLATAGAVPRDDDRSHDLVGHPLLATLGRDVRELQRTLGAVAFADEAVPAEPPTPDGLLGWLQADLRANAIDLAASRILRADDRSVQVHACHGPARQVEVLREVLLGLLADDPTLEPRDVLVMCPDVETYAPLIAAGFGLAEVVGDDGHPAHRLRVRLADRALDSTNPLLAVGARLLDLAGGRAGVGEVLDLAHSEPVRRRFGFRDDDLDQLADWAREAGIRWAFDAEHRADFGLQDYVANTWEFGLDRLLSGVAMSDDAQAWLDRTLPLDDVGSGDIELVGRLSEFVERLREVTDRLVGARPLEEWLDALEEGVAALTSVSLGDSWQSGQVSRELGRVRQASSSTPVGELRLPDVRAMLADRLAGRPTRANFRTGTLTVCTMVPMRSVPHRVVALLGLDDGVFPRVGSVDGDDLLARTPLTGERDARTEDRQLFLDAITAATETLVVTYTGANEFSGQRRPPAVPLGELLDALDLTATTADGGRVSETVTVRHPLQPFDLRNLEPGALVPGAPFSFDRAALAGARAALGERTPAPPLLVGPLPPPPTADGASPDVSLDDLLEFYKSPVKGFFRQRLDLALPHDDRPLDDGLPVEIDSLEQWAVGDRVLHDLLRGLPSDQVRQQEWRRAQLPPGQLGWRLLSEIISRAEPLAREALALRTRPATSVDVDVDLGDGRRLRGTVPEIYGDRLVPVSYSRLGATHRLQSWIRLLALAASDEDCAWTAFTLGRPTNSRSRSAHSLSQLGPLDHTARAALLDLVALRERGLTAPLPLPLKSSFAYARQRRTGATVDEALRKVGWDWDDGRFPGEQSDPEQVRAWGVGAGVPGLAESPDDGEGHPGESTRFGALAMRLWSPLLVAEQGSF
ncbi:DNA helicase/exodeoxyribonuclease V, gamma subunit [Nocardioides terrae]|uniref:RecBCD enzyme subunit RecC n=1 Tax=Nocardioides terrae TaxID=574651 RepID=A0A1I1F6E6_9ACTN|nr:exodeoxyribonuclease V subunit gamma [Nocardioides terrae]SFB92710.1 DNA helicase/exodeoxyribonuclease V, gamma subunit [Nocardioides terrae]